MAGIKNKACVPSTSWNRLRKLYGNEKIDYYNLLEESYLSARKNGTLTERKDEEVAYLLNRPSVTGKTVAVRYVPNADSYRAACHSSPAGQTGEGQPPDRNTVGVAK